MGTKFSLSLECQLIWWHKLLILKGKLIMKYLGSSSCTYDVKVRTQKINNK